MFGFNQRVVVIAKFSIIKSCCFYTFKVDSFTIAGYRNI